jgi:FkbM family methyltransferase
MKNFWKYALIVVMGSGIGAVAVGLDAGSHFVPQRAWLRAVNRWPSVRDLTLPVARTLNLLEPTWVEAEPGVKLLLDPKDYVSRDILIYGAWQPTVWAAVADALPEGGVLLDVGAHIGYDTLRGSVKVGPTGKVIAFEPNPNTLVLLRGNIAASKATNVIVQPIACTDQEQMLTLFDSTKTGNSGASSLSLANADEPEIGDLPSYSVRGRRIDDVVRELGLTRVDVIKIDIEGAETLAIRGARETLTRFHPKLVTEVVEHHLKNMNSSVAELTALMAELGYTHKPVDDTDWEWTPK